MKNYCSSLFDCKEQVLQKIAAVDYTQKESYTYQDIQQLVLKTAHYLSSKNVKQGDKVVIHYYNSIDTLIVHMACQFIGAVSCLVDPLVREKQISYFIEKTQSSHIYTHFSKELVDSNIQISVEHFSVEEIRNAWKCIDGASVDTMVTWNCDDTSYIYFTSGTTNLPKGVPLNYNNHINFFKIADIYWQPVDENSVHICYVPFSHGFGSVFLIPLTFRTQSQLIIHRSFHPINVIDSIQQNGGTHIYGVPSHYQQLLKMPNCKEATKSLKMAFCAAAKLDKEVMTEWETTTGIRLEEGYGLIETTGGIVWRVGSLAQKTGHMGQVPKKELIEIGILDGNNTPLLPNQLGEIAVRGASVMKGYLDNPEENQRVFANGWFKTGDEGYLSEDGNLFMTGRIKDIINIAGIKISPYEVESVLNEHPDVVQSIVVSTENDLYGEVVKAFVKTSNTETSERDLIRYASEHLINYQVPKVIEFIEEYPLNSMGKIDRKKLRKQGEVSK